MSDDILTEENRDTPAAETTADGAAQKPERSVSSDLIRGHINTIILRALYDGDKYGYEIIAEIEQKSHGQYSMKQPSLYSALKRLEKDGYVTSYWGGSVSGGRRKYFTLTEAGKLISEQNQAEWEYSRTVIDSLISDKDFDFSNPAPTAVDMRMLRDTTSRVPHAESDEEELDYRPAFDDDAELKRLEENYREQMHALEAEKTALEEKRVELLREKERFEENMRARNDALLRERSWREHEIAERERVLAEKREALEALRAAEQNERAQAESAEAAALSQTIEQLQTELSEQRTTLEARVVELEDDLRDGRQEHETQIADMQREIDQKQAELDEALRKSEEALAEERRKTENAAEEAKKQYEEELAAMRAQSEQAFSEEQERHRRELVEQEQRILAEQEELFRKREQQLLHRNYLDLVNAPPAEEPPAEYNYVTPPAEEVQAPAAEDYRTVVHRLYANAVSGESEESAAERARPLDGIDFTDLESRAAQDGIRIRTAGGKLDASAPSDSIVHKGKALFFSGILAFLFCVALGGVVMGVRAAAGIPVFYPYLIWAIGLAVLLVTGLAYANHYGERALRRTGPVILNSVVGYILLVIVTLIVALAARADLTVTSQLINFVIIPVVFFFGVVIFGISYYLQVRPKKE